MYGKYLDLPCSPDGDFQDHHEEQPEFVGEHWSRRKDEELKRLKEEVARWKRLWRCGPEGRSPANHANGRKCERGWEAKRGKLRAELE